MFTAFPQWLHRWLSKWQFSVPTISSKWLHYRFNDYCKKIKKLPSRFWIRSMFYLTELWENFYFSEKKNDLEKNGLPTRAWRRQLSHQLDKVSEGRRPEHLLNNPGTVLNLLTYNCVPPYIWGYFSEMRSKSHWIHQRICRQSVIAVQSRCQGAVGCIRLLHVRAYSLKQ